MKAFVLFLTTILLSNAHGQLPVPLPLLSKQSLMTQPTSNIFITLNNPLDPIYKQFSSKSYANREAKIEALTKGLKDVTSVWHKPVIDGLKPFGVDAKSLWVTNQIYVRNANPVVVAFVRGLSAVMSIAEEIVLPILPVFNPVVGSPPNGTEWGVKRINAEAVWNTTKGERIKVAVIDTGVRGTHTALKDNYVGRENNGWFDPILGGPVPTDENGHGTHCAGTICGNNGIGVAPRAKWMACRGCTSTGCPQYALLRCGEWVLAPTDAQGQNPDSSKAPNIVSCSWGSDQGGQTWYNDVIKAWNAAGIIGVFAIGNSGPECSTAGSPGDQKGIISVGSVDFNDTVSSFSSRGPKKVPDGSVAPLIVAPGSEINSAYHLTDNAYQKLSGTSMATPHFSGAAALLLSRNPQLTLDQLMQLVFPNSQKNLGATGGQCGQNSEAVYPNDIAGNGRLDVSQAFSKMTS